jgi:hypothetical protein
MATNYWFFHLLQFFNSLLAIYKSFLFAQQVHSKYNNHVFGLENYEVDGEVYPLILRFNLRHIIL